MTQHDGVRPRPVSIPPPATVLAAWGVDTAKPLGGGQGTAFLGGDLVLKPVLDERQLDWLAPVLFGLSRFDDLRIIRPRPGRDGRWAVDGWSGWEYLEGETDPARWQDGLSVSDRFHDVVSDVARSPAVPGRHPWATGDAFAWGEVDITFPVANRPLIAQLKEMRSSVRLPCQLVHCDLGGNILYHPKQPPAVIDISPFWRPKPYADAILVVDSIAWAGATLDALEPLSDPDGVQMIYRAILFRLGAAAIIFEGHDTRLGVEVAAYQPIVQALAAA